MNRPTPTKNKTINKAEELRLLKLKKLQENNTKISKQIDRSADSWKTSMEQIRKIAKKTQDSSQILDCAFTENENDRSDIDSDVQKDYPRPMMKESNFYRSAPQHYGQFRPLSQHASYASAYFNQGKYPDFNHRMFNEYQPYNMENNNMKNMPNLLNGNQSNTYSYNQMPMANRSINPWVGGLNQSNCAIMPQYSNFQNYPPPYPRPSNFYPTSFNFPNIMPMNPNYYPPPSMYNPLVNPYRQPYPQPREDVNGIESMKKYVNSLLDKLELLNDTVLKLKNQNQSNNQQIAGCSHQLSLRPSVNQGYRENHIYRSPSCCGCERQAAKIHRSCSCWELQQTVNRRPSSSLSETYSNGPQHNYHHNKYEKRSYTNSHQNCNRGFPRPQMPPRQHQESPLPIRQQYRDNNYRQNSNYHNHTPQHIPISNQYFSYSNQIRPPSSSVPIESNTPGVAVVIDNSNNNNLMNVIVDSSDKSNDLLSLSELADTTM